MKIAITGHTRGIGKAIYAKLVNTNLVIGLSRSSGYDISNVDHIIDAVKDCDVFINNAYDALYQEQLLSKLYNLWSGQQKIIINIGSTVTDYPRIESNLEGQPWPYRDHKLLLQSTFRKLSWIDDNCRLVLINPGATDTDMIKHLDCKKIDPIEIAKVVELVLNNPYIKEITVYEK
jgi:NAD(P)-dependent dehydrogenase (short-subunit alcohol dehydrogenase family)